MVELLLLSIAAAEIRPKERLSLDKGYLLVELVCSYMDELRGYWSLLGWLLLCEVPLCFPVSRKNSYSLTATWAF